MLDSKRTEVTSSEFHLSRSRDVIGHVTHVTNGFPIGHFLLVVIWKLVE